MLTSLMITLKYVMEWNTHKYISKLEKAELILILVQLTFGVYEKESLHFIIFLLENDYWSLILSRLK